MRVSIIIPVLKINDYIRESIPEIAKLDFADYEVIVLPNIITDEDVREFAKYPKVRLIATIESGPAFKRDFGARSATGDILAFLDDDAYPKTDWLTIALRHFDNDPKIAAVGGPAITPISDSIRQKASGAIFTSKLGGGNLTYRYWPGKKVLEVDDFPSVNLLVKKSVFNEIGGFDSLYWPGEDTKLCHDIVTSGYKIIYDPRAIVWHHRRASLIKHLKQVSNYAIHRGFFVKKYPANSLHFHYFAPSLFTLFLLSGLVLFPLNYLTSIRPLLFVYLGLVTIYLFLLLLSGIIEANRIRNIIVGILVIPAIFLTHLCYGTGFIIGLLKRKLKQ